MAVLMYCTLAAPTAAAMDLRRAAVGRSNDYHGALILASEKSSGFSVAAVDGIPGASIPLKIRMPAASGTDAGSSGTYTFLMFKGFPENFKLSAGFKTKNTWMVSITDLANLKVEIPAGYQGDCLVDAILYRGENVAPDNDVFAVHISPSGNVPTSAPTSFAPVTPAAPAKAKKAPASRDPSLTNEEEIAMLSQAEKQIESGNIVFARLLFEQLSARGSAQGTFQLARTYDPAVLRQLGTVGMQGDIEKAKGLYQRAAELGSTQASKSLSALGQ